MDKTQEQIEDEIAFLTSHTEEVLKAMETNIETIEKFYASIEQLAKADRAEIEEIKSYIQSVRESKHHSEPFTETLRQLLEYRTDMHQVVAKVWNFSKKQESEFAKKLKQMNEELRAYNERRANNRALSETF